MVLWNEIFLTRKLRKRRTGGEAQYFEEQEGRNFLLLVGLGHQLLGAILQTGGCAAQPSGRIRPDPFYVDQVRFKVITGLFRFRVFSCSSKLTYRVTLMIEHLGWVGLDLVCKVCSTILLGQ